ncbi:translocation/assembly module TamB domain-containing protein [Pseudomonas sp. CCC3.2]|uniref:translocation/assembly module TamB domain-containing protein n=1 Tax=unclassified Pseudomonas TaxID=196821 RepID=UPI002AB51B95|nr:MULTISPECIES: translocation/assembly module TamB domain-containing protein [unclassified Pseudomonas]MDY7560098.1 translocation/assembly module TamB domain-containing protein [Pseudomonas sp. AB6]MEB0180052.1 translocation/assembly module TamB domain-containing protein [Pseudomonas sp. CCC3.2]MEB0211209.1 translocation/assembly module TamB domain-containing protein [Pseudomonas sp. AB6]
MKRATKIAVISLTGFFTVLAILVLGLYAILATDAGSRWALGQVPGLQVDNFNGRLAGEWRADRLRWVQGDNQVEVDSAVFVWSPSCLMTMTLCLDQVWAHRISLQFPPVPEQNSGPITLPTIKLPLAIRLGDVRIDSLSLNGSEQLKDLQLTAQWTSLGVQIGTAHLQRDDLVLDLSGVLQPNGDWPLTALGQLKLPAPGNVPWTLALNIQGDLLKTLHFNADSAGYLQGELAGRLQPLVENLPAQVKITAESFKAAADLPDTLQLNQLVLIAGGNLKDGYQVTGNASLPAEKSPVALMVKGRVDAQGADIAAIDLTAGSDQSMRLSGRLAWQQGLSADAKIEWLSFPWHRLYPAVAEPQVSVRTFAGEVSYSDGRYLGNFNSTLDGPAGAFTLSSPFSGDLKQVFLPQLELSAGQGKASGHLTLQFADGIGWDTALDLSAINPAYWLAELPGNLAGPLRSEGEFRNQKLTLTADLDLKGKLRGQPAVLQAKADGAGDKWTVSALDIRLGDNRVQGNGSVQQKLLGHLNINLPHLSQLWPQLQGQLKGSVNLAGSLQSPQGQISLTGGQLVMGNNHLKTLTLDAKLDSTQRGFLDSNVAGIRFGDTQLGTLIVTGQGDIKRQNMQVSLKGPLLKLALVSDGSLDKGNWRGRLASGEVQTGGQDWRLQQPAKLERLADGKINFGAHCWISGAASLCGEDQRLMPEPRLRYHLKQFPLDSLAQWFPKDFAWEGSLNADVQIDLPASGPNGKISVDANGGRLRLLEKDQWLDFPYESLKLSSTLTPKRIDSRLDFRGGKLGTLSMTAQIDPLAKSRPITGNFDLRGLDISIARPFVPMVEKLTGRLNGSGHVSGSLLAPQVSGEITLSDGQASGPELPLTVQDLKIQALISGESVRLNGSWSSGNTGRGSLNGQVAWGEALAVDVNLKGTHLPVTVEPYAELDVAPDLHISMKGDKLAISGKVLIPKGSITVRELPPSTVKLSGDVVIIGQQAIDSTQPKQPSLAMAMDIDVTVGEEMLSFTGFGLTANLAGHVHIGDNLDTRGELNLNDGRYRAYGQRLIIRKARLLFAGPIDQPYLDIEAVRQIDDVIAGIRLTGSAEQPTTVVFSEPAMTQEQALSYLVLGHPLTTTGADSNMMAQAALALGLAGSSSTTGALAKNLGIKNFELDTAGSGTTTSVVASGKITDKISLRYGVGVFDPANTIALRYTLSKKVYLEAASGIASSLDIFYKRDF